MTPTLAELSGSDLAVVVVTGCAIVAVIALLGVLGWCLVTLRRMTRAVQQLQSEAVPLIEELTVALAEANEQLDRAEQVVGSAESISATVDATSKLAYRALSAPVIKTVAMTSGASRAARRMRKED